MSRPSASKSYMDVFNAYLVSEASFAGKWEMPRIPVATRLPTRLISFDNLCNKQYDSYVHFYCHDYKFENLWKQPNNYLNKFQNYAGIKSPDFSIYRDMPLCMQMWNTYRNRALAYWFSINGIPVIPNVRWGDERSWEFCFDGIPLNSIVAVGSHGCLRDKLEREFFASGLAMMIDTILPSTIIVYGRAPDDIFNTYRDRGIHIHQFLSSFHTSRNRGAM